MESGGALPLPSSAASLTSISSDLNPDAPKQTKICVYCGASAGSNAVHINAARALARAMAANNIALGKSLAMPIVHTSPLFLALADALDSPSDLL
jgi:hypothetical protein